jgi:putative copper resistance protein D
MVAQSLWGIEVRAQLSSEHHRVSVAPGTTNNLHGERSDGEWEGSAQGIAYSEFNHRLVGLFVLLFGLAELGHALRCLLPFWTRLVLPGALGIIGAYLLIWSDHEAWPIGSLTLVETFSGQDPEILQHKFYGVFATIAAVSETLRRIGWARHPAWAGPLVIGGMIGGLLLFWHSHGNHPANHTIELHHALLGILGVGAALSKAMLSWTFGTSTHPAKKWALAWAGFVILIGLQLLVYFE